MIFRVTGNQAVLTRTPPFESLAGTIAVPADRRGSAWEDVIRTTRTRRSFDRSIDRVPTVTRAEP